MGSRGQEDLQHVLARFAIWLRSRPLTDAYVQFIVGVIRAGWADPVGHVSAIRSYQVFTKSQGAWKHWGEWTNQEEPARTVSRLRPPRELPAKPRVLPTDVQLRAAAEQAAGLSLPYGPLLWIVYLSGLRVGEVVKLERLEAEQAMRSPEVTIRAKGMGGFQRRTWVPGCLVRVALGALLTRPWRSAWVLLSSDADGAAALLRKRIPGGFHPHDFRHAVARLLRRMGCQDSLIGAVLGHDLSAIMGTTAIYAPPSPEELEVAHAGIASYLWPDGLVPPAGSWLVSGGFPGGSSCRAPAGRGGSSAPPGGRGRDVG